MVAMGITLIILGLGGMALCVYIKLGMWLWNKLDESEKSHLLPWPWRVKCSVFIKKNKEILAVGIVTLIIATIPHWTEFSLVTNVFIFVASFVILASYFTTLYHRSRRNKKKYWKLGRGLSSPAKSFFNF